MKSAARFLGVLLGATTLLNAPDAAAQTNALSDEDARRMLQATARFLLSRAENEMSAAVAERIRATLCVAHSARTLSIDAGADRRDQRINLANFLFPAVCNAVTADLPLADRPALTLREGLRADLRALPQRVLEARDTPTAAVSAGNRTFAVIRDFAAPINAAIAMSDALSRARSGEPEFINAVKNALGLSNQLTLPDADRNNLPEPERRTVNEQRAIIEALRNELNNADPAVLRARLGAVLALAPTLRSQPGVATLVLAILRDDPVAIGRATMALAGPIFPGAAGQLAHFALAIASAEREDDIVAAIESFIEPVGSWRARGERDLVGVSAVLGFQAGGVFPFSPAGRDRGAFSVAPSLSLGIQYSIATGKAWSFRFHFQVIDLGALVRFNGYDLSFNVQELGDRPISWTSVLAPGLLVGGGARGVPIFFGAGVTIHPEFAFGPDLRAAGFSNGAVQVFGFISTSFDLMHF